MDDLQELEQHDQRGGLASVVGKWKGFGEIADAVDSARASGGDGRDGSL